MVPSKEFVSACGGPSSSYFRPRWLAIRFWTSHSDVPGPFPVASPSGITHNSDRLAGRSVQSQRFDAPLLLGLDCVDCAWCLGNWERWRGKPGGGLSIDRESSNPLRGPSTVPPSTSPARDRKRRSRQRRAPSRIPPNPSRVLVTRTAAPQNCPSTQAERHPD
jgi:hypothetical protein